MTIDNDYGSGRQRSEDEGSVPTGGTHEFGSDALKPTRVEDITGRIKENALVSQKPPLDDSGDGDTSWDSAALEKSWTQIKKRLRAMLGDDVYGAWFNAADLVGYDRQTAFVSVPTQFLKRWIEQHYLEKLVEACKTEFEDVDTAEISVRSHAVARKSDALPPLGTENASDARALYNGRPNTGLSASAQTFAGGMEGSPLDPRYNFENFVVGTSNRLPHAASKQIAETLLEQSRTYNPLFIHSAVGLGKTHLLHAIAWEVKRRNPNAQVLYLTAEKFRYSFVEALRSQEAMAFKDRLRSIDLFLVDDMEFLSGQQTEQEFDHTLNSLLDSGKQVVVASSRAPAHLDRLDLRMRSRLSGGLVTEIQSLDYELRLNILERRAAEKRANDPTFQVSRDVLEFLATKLTENARELEGAINRVYAAIHMPGRPITLDAVEDEMRDLLRGTEPPRVKIDEIQRVISKHFGVSKSDLLSHRRHRSIVWPRQIGMYLSKELTSRSLPEIGRKFGNRDHTTVLHAIRKVKRLILEDPAVRDEVEDLMRLLRGSS